MSVEALSWAWQTDVTPPASKLLLLALADAANEDGECWPRIAALAAKTGLSGRHVKRLLRDLEERRLLAAAERFQGRQTSNLYRLPLRGDTHATSEAARGDTQAPPGVTPASPPNHEPKVEPKEKNPPSPLPTLPAALGTAEFRTAWERRLRERQELPPSRRPSPTQLEAQLAKLAKLAAARGVEHAVACVERATEAGHQGVVFPEDFNGGNGHHRPERPARHLPALAGLNPIDLERYKARCRRPE